MLSVRPNTGAPEELLRADESDPGVTVALYRDSELPDVHIVVTRWQASAEDRAAFAAGEDLYVIQLSDNKLVQPIRPFVGAAVLKDNAFPNYVPPSSPTVPTDSEGPEC